MHLRSTTAALTVALSTLVALGCQPGDGSADAGHDAGLPATHKLAVDIAFTADDAGVPFMAQNGSVIHLEKSELAGKPYFWVTTKMGESFANGTPLEAGGGALSGALTATFETGSKYEDGAVELSLFISVAGGNTQSGPRAGDLAAFDLTAPPAGEPQPTGSSVRVHFSGADAQLSLANQFFIRF
jgi:hypothetical protein